MKRTKMLLVVYDDVIITAFQTQLAVVLQGGLKKVGPQIDDHNSVKS